MSGRGGVPWLRSAVRDPEPSGAGAGLQRDGCAALRRAPHVGRGARGGRRYGGETDCFHTFVANQKSTLLARKPQAQV